jgi:hypothetical protein
MERGGQGRPLKKKKKDKRNILYTCAAGTRRKSNFRGKDIV